ncbi:hypothetical protein [Mesorhizobium sp. B2-3-4]|uniref:hypothetical protein n=1 Tax=Mesorhizobium sp. B2-3-4 TaxID=2589959 RepID=UPI00112E0B83|nr:hypothetical protein [Mesorhizobium sp. B2-3-4]TPM38135.1 hypothetical protein FJ967_12745 [Mesorhizobium sp. B2-3-4]
MKNNAGAGLPIGERPILNSGAPPSRNHRGIRIGYRGANKTRLEGGSLAQISTMDRIVALLPSLRQWT